jgi:hypothetical protein
MAFADNLTGIRFSYLLVQKRNQTNTNSGKPQWVCLCDCGRVVVVAANNLKAGNVKSCGCWRKERMTIENRTHGLSNTPEYDAWAAMKRRCFLETNENYSRYGGRNITVCESWINSFENFYEDMGPRPSPEHTLDREDNNGNYDKNNCRWATQLEQANNRSTNTYCEFEGEVLTVAQLARKINMDYELLLSRLLTGRTVDEVINFESKRGKK